MRSHYLFSIVTAFIFNVLTITLASSNSSAPTTSPQNKTCHFPAIFNFGDSNSDTGGLAALFGQFPPPHGVPFFGSPTGRYCDGRLVIDFLAEGLGYPFLSPYLDSIGSNFRHGVNFATAGATAIPRNIITHRQSPISLDYQWNQFSDFHNKSQIVRDRGGFYRKLFPKATDFSTALYTIDIGQNDLTNSSLLNQTEPQVTSFLQDVVNQTHNLIRNIYSLGGRNFIVHSVGPLGCLAYVIEGTPDLNSSGIDNIGCSIPYNQVAQTYNNHLRQAIVQLRKDLPLAAITYVDMYSIKYSLFREPRRHGFKQWLRACCGRGGKYNYDIHMGCGAIKFVNGKEISVRKICNHPGEYVIWDGVHFTEASNKFIYKRFVKGEFSDPAVPLRRSCHT